MAIIPLGCCGMLRLLIRERIAASKCESNLACLFLVVVSLYTDVYDIKHISTNRF